MLRKYVDDILTAWNEIQIGSYWDPVSKSIMWSSDQFEKDKQEGLSPDHITMRLIAEIGSSIMECLTFTFDTPNQNQLGRMPVLDTQMWVGEQARSKGIPDTISMESNKITRLGNLKKVILFGFFKKTYGK